MKPADLLDLVAPLTPFEESGCVCKGEDYYSARSLYDQAAKEKAKPYKIRVRDVDFCVNGWRTNDVRLADYAYHARRAMAVDLSIPIIVGPLGGIMDGYHRLMRALLDGEEYVLAVRLKELPEATKDPDPDKG